LLLKDALEYLLREQEESPEVARLIDFITESQRGICRPRANTPPEYEEGGE
jgi:acyl-[acyl carrier protein]--UDP-N-acetylglucosamine O-acyltransferase